MRLKRDKRDDAGEGAAIAWHALAPRQVFEELDSAENGLGREEVGKRREIHGANTLPSVKTPSLPMVFLRQFLSPLIYISHRRRRDSP